MANNKVKFNLWNVHYAPLLTNTISSISYGKPIPIPGAVSLSLDVCTTTIIQTNDTEYYEKPHNKAICEHCPAHG